MALASRGDGVFDYETFSSLRHLFPTGDACTNGGVCSPYEELARKRAQCPVHVSTPPGGQPSAVVYGHAEVQQVLRSPDLFSSSVYEGNLGMLLGRTILEMDEPAHRRHRLLVARAFQPASIEYARHTIISPIVNELLDALSGSDRADLVPGLTLPFPIRVVATLLGLPPEDHSKFQRWTLGIITTGTRWPRAVRASRQLTEYLRPIVADRRREPREDLISVLCQAEVEDSGLDDEEIFSFVRLLLPAGVETTYRAGGNLLYALLTHRDQLVRVLEDPDLVAKAIEEAIRWEPPVLSLLRVATRDSVLGGAEIKAGTAVCIHLGAANRDPGRYREPEAYDVSRVETPAGIFGAGPHLCLGRHLALVELTELVTALFLRFPDLRLDESRPRPHVHGDMFRSPPSLPVVLR
jgi:cytochrome P450